MVGAVSSRTTNYNFAIVRYDSIGWHTYEHDNWRTVDALLQTVVGIPSVRGVWANSVAYAVGDRVIDTTDSTTWRCVSAHTSASTGTFAAGRTANPTYWTRTSTVPAFVGDWVTSVTYNVNDIVRNGNAWYYCVEAHTSGTFLTDFGDGKWETIVDYQDAIDAETAAVAAAASATTSAAAAAASATTAEVAKTNAVNSALLADNSATGAVIAQAVAASSASAAATSASNAAASASSADGSADAAAASAARAATFDPSTYYNKVQIDATVSGLNDSIASANVNANGRVSKSGDTMTGSLWLNYENPALSFYWGGVKYSQWLMDGSGTMILRDGNSGQNHFYVTAGGAVWTQQLGDLNSRIEDSANAWSAARRDEANSYANHLHNVQQGDVNERVHRIRFVGYGESAAGGWSYDAPIVVNDVFFNGYACHRRVKTLQMHIPAQGGWVNVWNS